MEKVIDIQEFVEELESDGVQFTDHLHEAIWILEDGTMIDGEFECGYRGTDHNIILDAEEDDYEGVHVNFNALRVVPETMIVLVSTEQDWEDNEMIDWLIAEGFEIEEY